VIGDSRVFNPSFPPTADNTGFDVFCCYSEFSVRFAGAGVMQLREGRDGQGSLLEALIERNVRTSQFNLKSFLQRHR